MYHSNPIHAFRSDASPLSLAAYLSNSAITNCALGLRCWRLVALPPILSAPTIRQNESGVISDLRYFRPSNRATTCSCQSCQPGSDSSKPPIFDKADFFQIGPVMDQGASSLKY